MFFHRLAPISVHQLDPGLMDASTPELLERLDDHPLSLRVAAACALALRGDPRGLDALVEGLQKKGLRYPSLEALRALGDARAREPVSRVFRKRFLSHFDRTQAAGTLAALGGDDGKAHLLEKLTARRFQMDRGLAIELAAELALEESIPPLAAIADDPEDLFRGAALKALAVLAPDEARPRVRALVADAEADPDVRADAVEALAHLGGAEAEETLARLAREDDGEPGEAARQILAR